MDIGIKGAVTVGDIGDALNDVAIGVAVLVIGGEILVGCYVDLIALDL